MKETRSGPRIKNHIKKIGESQSLRKRLDRSRVFYVFIYFFPRSQKGNQTHTCRKLETGSLISSHISKFDRPVALSFFQPYI